MVVAAVVADMDKMTVQVQVEALALDEKELAFDDEDEQASLRVGGAMLLLIAALTL